MYVEKKYFSLEEMLLRWQMPERDLGYLAENDELRLSVRVFALRLETGRENASSDAAGWDWDPAEPYTGLLDLHAGDAYMVFRCAERHLTEFRDTTGGRMRIPEDGAAEHVMLGDLLVRREERDRLERARGFTGTEFHAGHGAFSASLDFRSVSWRGSYFRLGGLQAQVVRELRRSAETGEPWQSGKRLLTLVNSRSMRMADVFKSQPNWRDLIESNGRGHYRLRPETEPAT